MKKFDWKEFAATTRAAGNLPWAAWGVSKGSAFRRHLDHGEATNAEDLSKTLESVAGYCVAFDSLFYCWIDEMGKFHSVSIG
jgi:hypothetical protein